MDVVLEHLDTLVDGFEVTLKLTFLAYAVTLVLGAVVATMRVSPVAPLRAAGFTYVETLRNTPLPALFLLFYLGLAKLGLNFSAFTWAVIVLSAYHGAFAAEAVRSGINTVGAGQVEAARSLGLTFTQILRFVVLPQAMRSVVAPLGNVFIALGKNSSIAGVISVYELLLNTSRTITQFSHPVPFLIGAGLFYVALSLSAAAVFGVIERKVAIAR